jgi:hypothetical protein
MSVSDAPKPGDYVMQPAFSFDGWKIVRWTDRPGAYWEVVRRVHDRVVAMGETQRLAADARTTAWAYEPDNTFLRL